MSTENVKQITVKKIPFIINKNIIFPAGKKPIQSNNIKIVKSIKHITFQDDIIYESKHGDFTSGEAHSMTIFNRMNMVTKLSKTVAKCISHSGEYFEKNSDDIVKLIGHSNYTILFSSLCSILSQELKIRSINSLLTVPKTFQTVSCQTDSCGGDFVSRNLVDSSTQTNDTDTEYNLKKEIPRKRRLRRAVFAPYVVKDNPDANQSKRVIIDPKDFDKVIVKEECDRSKTKTVDTEQGLDNALIKEERVVRPDLETTDNQLPELHSVFDEDSNHSIGKLSSLSVSIPDLLANPLSVLTNIDKYTKDNTTHTNQDTTMATDVCNSHKTDYATQSNFTSFSSNSEVLPDNVTKEQRIKQLLKQGFNDFKFCMVRDSNGHLPIHVAVMSNDIDLLRRQCLALKMRNNSVDILADGLTPLKMSLFQENTELMAILLEFDADLLETDDDDKTLFHHAAELDSDHLQVLVNHCKHNARKILKEDEQHWKPGYESKTDAELAQILLAHVNKSFDNQGYTPLMLASKLGKYTNVSVLVESCAGIVNVKMPSSGNTALYLAVGAACMDAAERGNKSKVVDHFRKTIEILVENGADPNICNFAGSNTNELLIEFSIAELSMIVANKLTSIRFFDNKLPSHTSSGSYMIVKDKDGNMNLKELKEKKSDVKPKVKKPSPLQKTVTPYIIEKVSFKPVHSSKQPDASVLHTVNSVSTPGQRKTLITQLNKPLIIRSDLANNKRKLELVIESKKIKRTD